MYDSNMDIDLIKTRQKRLKMLISERYKGSRRKFALSHELHPQQVSRWLSEDYGNRERFRAISYETCRIIEKKEDIEEKWLDKDNDCLVKESSPASVEQSILEDSYKSLANAGFLGPDGEIALMDSEQAADPKTSIQGGDVYDYLWTIPGMKLHRGNSFYLILDDDSMESKSGGRSYISGDFALAEMDAEPKPGEIVIARLNGAKRAIMRRYRDLGGGVYELEPFNEFYPKIKIEKPGEATILGVVRRVIVQS